MVLTLRPESPVRVIVTWGQPAADPVGHIVPMPARVIAMDRRFPLKR
ncbi:hypothetical protein F11_01720 [Rhodospirillum rubrum F11]|nr:hypothetical protein F11_01720 [Rhodospirillum rubrum F11]